MAYELVRDGDYPGTDLPVFKVFPADDPKAPAIGEVWGVGTKGVTGRFVPTGVRWQLSRAAMTDTSPLYPAGAYAAAARDMIKKYEA